MAPPPCGVHPFISCPAHHVPGSSAPALPLQPNPCLQLFFILCDLRVFILTNDPLLILERFILLVSHCALTMKGAKERTMCFICTAPSNSATQWTDTFWVPAISLSVHQIHETQKGDDPGTWFGKKLTDQWILSNSWALASCHTLFLLLWKPNIGIFCGKQNGSKGV